jgi:hypothetical protein
MVPHRMQHPSDQSLAGARHAQCQASIPRGLSCRKAQCSADAPPPLPPHAVRLPFRFSELARTATSYVEAVCTVPTISDIKALTLPTDLAPNAATYADPEPYEGWKCMKPISNGTYRTRGNIYVPGSRPNDPNRPTATVGDRFKWVVQYFVARGFYVAMDYHPYMQGNMATLLPDHLLYSNATALGEAWGKLMGEFKALPSWRFLQGRLIVDVANELDIVNAQWDTQGAPRSPELRACAPYKDLVNAVIRGVAAVNPDTIVSVGGVGQTGDKCNNWGVGHRTASTTGSSADNWFKSVGANYTAAAVALSTHVYCEWSYHCSRDELAARNDVNWGVKSSVPIYGKLYPYILGEIGAGWDPYWQSWPRVGAPLDPNNRVANETALTFAQNNRDTGFRSYEQQCLDWTVDYHTSGSYTYANQTTMTHALPAGVFWWAYNFNSGGTGGLVNYNKGDDLSKDGIAIKWYKVQYMERLAGLKPWYRM